MDKPQPRQPRTVAVVGTGMAGLATAHLLHQDPSKRYQVTLLEKVSVHPSWQSQGASWQITDKLDSKIKSP